MAECKQHPEKIAIHLSVRKSETGVYEKEVRANRGKGEEQTGLRRDGRTFRVWLQTEKGFAKHWVKPEAVQG